jgi:Protein of unknown function (DUF1579)
MISAKSVWFSTPLAAVAVCALGASAWFGQRAPERLAQDEAPPGPSHERLMKLAGKYSSVTKFVGGEGAAPETTGEATFTSILGGRFLLQEEKGTMFGQSFETRKTYGYNAGTKRYEGLWIYTGSTAMMTLSGTGADEGKTITFDASYETSPGKKKNLDVTFTELGPDKFSIVLKSKPDESGQGATMETVYTRKK